MGGLGIMIDLFLILVAILVLLLVAVSCCALVGFGLYRKSPWMTSLGAIPLGLIVVAVSLVVYQVAYAPAAPLAEQAKAIVELPPEATVISVEHGSWSGDGVVVFSLPDTKTPEEWVDHIWQANWSRRNTTPNTPMEIDEPLHKVLDGGEEARDLEYRPESETYLYHAILPI